MKDVRNMTSPKKQTAIFNKMIGQHLDLTTISATFKGAVHVIEPGDEDSSAVKGPALNVYVDETNRVNGFSLPKNT